MARDEEEGFLSRWSRLKKEVRHAEERAPERKPEVSPVPAVAPAAVPPKESSADEVGASSGASVPQLPPIDSLKGLASEYTEFLKPGVDESLRRSALKKLFSDPYFETFERFEAYCEDYTKGEPIPAAMLKTLTHARRLLFDEKKEEEGGVAESGKPLTEAPAQAEEKAEAPAVLPQPEEKT
jgi:hypothetical protein